MCITISKLNIYVDAAMKQRDRINDLLRLLKSGNNVLYMHVPKIYHSYIVHVLYSILTERDPYIIRNY